MTNTQLSVELLEGLAPDAWTTLQQLGRAFRVKESDLQSTLDAIVESSTNAIPQATFASVNTLERGRFVPQAAAGQPPSELDDLQLRTSEGPCVTASATQAVVLIADTANDLRWPQYADLACRLGVRSILCVPLWVDDMRLGSLSLYCPQANGLTEDHVKPAELFAVFSSLALADAQRTANLRRAADNRDLIGQAKGILMERHGINADEAFARLSAASQNLNSKLIDVAQALIAQGVGPRR